MVLGSCEDGFVWGRAPREPDLSEDEGSKPSEARQSPQHFNESKRADSKTAARILLHRAPSQTPKRTEVLELVGRCSRNVLDSNWPYWNPNENEKFVRPVLYVRPGDAVTWSAEGMAITHSSQAYVGPGVIERVRLRSR